MSGRKRANKNHPKYGEYIEKCQALQKQEHEELEPLTVADGDGPLEAIFSKYNKKLKALQEEYSYLFTEAAEGEEE